MKNELLHLYILDDFNCLGGECPSSCCKFDWRLDVDSGTYSKWQSLSDLNVRERVLNSLQLDEDTGHRVLKKGDKGQCTLLTDDGYCWAQQQLGAESIPETCQQYPRVYVHEYQHECHSAKMTCPEIVRLLYESSADGKNIFKKGNIKKVHPQKKSGIDPLLIELLDSYIEEIQKNKGYQPNIKLYLIAKTLDDISEYSIRNQLTMDKFKELCSNARVKLSDIKQLIESNGIEHYPVTDGSFWKFIFGFSSGIDQLINIDDELVTLLNKNNDSEEYFESIYQKVLSYRQEFLGKVDKSYWTFMDNFIRVKFVNAHFPWSPHKDSFVATFLFCLYPYTLIQLLLYISTHNKEISDKDLISVVYKVEQALDQNLLIYNFLDKNPEYLNMRHYLSCVRMV